MKKTPHYLMGTANSRAKKVNKQPSNDTKKKTHRRGASPFDGNKDSMVDKANENTLWIEELPINQLRLEYNHFRVAYKEFRVLNELTVIILQDMGIFLKAPPKNKYSDLDLEVSEDME